MKKACNLSNIEASFKSFLRAENLSPGSIRNYLSDVNYFIGWYNIEFGPSLSSKAQSTLFSSTFLSTIRGIHIEQYKNYLLSTNTPLRTLNRRLSSMRKFGAFAVVNSIWENNYSDEVANSQIPSSSELFNQQVLSEFISDNTDHSDSLHYHLKEFMNFIQTYTHG